MCFFTASGEPPICMSSSALFAVKKAIVAARALAVKLHTVQTNSQNRDIWFTPLPQ